MNIKDNGKDQQLINGYEILYSQLFIFIYLFKLKQKYNALYVNVNMNTPLQYVKRINTGKYRWIDG